MPLLPPCKDHTARIESLEKNMASLVSTISGLIEALKDSNSNITQAVNSIHGIKELQEQAYTPPQLDPDNYSYFR
jgi:hypothetical protein